MQLIPEKKNKSIFKTYLIYFIVLLAFVGIRVMSSLGVFTNLSNNWIDIIYSSIIEIGCLFVLPLVLYCVFLKQKPKQVFKTCNFYRTNFKTILYSVILGFLIYFLTIALSTFFNGILVILGFSSSTGGGSESMDVVTYIIQIFTTALLPAFCEEFLHRGIVLQGTKHAGFHRSIIFSSILFGLIHFNITQVFYAAILGIVMGYAAVVSKNIWPAIIIHFMNNFMSVTNSFLSSASTEYAEFVQNIYNTIFGMNFVLLVVLITIGFMLLLIAIYWLLNRLYYHGLVSKVENAIRSTYDSSGNATSSNPIMIGHEDVKYLVESTTSINLDFQNIKNPIDVIMPKQDKKYKESYKDKIFLKSSIVIGVVITVFTLIWGFM